MQSFFMRATKIQISMREGWFESSLGALVQWYIFAHGGSYLALDGKATKAFKSTSWDIYLNTICRLKEKFYFDTIRVYICRVKRVLVRL